VAVESSIVSGVAGRYATALFDLAEEAKALDSTAADLAQLKTMIAESADLKTLVRSPVISRDEQARGMDAVAEKAGFSDLTRKLIATVTANRRLNQIVAICEAFRRLLAAHRGEVTANVTSARPLTAEQMEALKAELRRATGRIVDVDAKVDETLLGGLVVKVGSRMIDSSLKTKLNSLTQVMKGIG
jgi:F-type H+-transporting ATPase subunit delta